VESFLVKLDVVALMFTALYNLANVPNKSIF